MKTKICKRCKKEKDIDDFYKDKSRKDGYFSYCIDCSKQHVREHYISNKTKRIDYQKEYYKNHKEEKAKYDKLRRSNRKLKDKRNANENRLYKEDMSYRLKKKARNCITKSFLKKNYTKKSNTYEILGCDYKTFEKYLLETFKNNYGYEYDGIEEVHIDHITPLSIAKDEDDIIRLCHYSNLQLLKAKDNLKKGAKLNYEIGG